MTLREAIKKSPAGKAYRDFTLPGTVKRIVVADSLDPFRAVVDYPEDMFPRRFLAPSEFKHVHQQTDWEPIK